MHSVFIVPRIALTINLIIFFLSLEAIPAPSDYRKIPIAIRAGLARSSIRLLPVSELIPPVNNEYVYVALSKTSVLPP